MRRCRDDHDREFYFHGFFDRDGHPVVIVEDVESHRLTELAVTDVTFKSEPPLYSKAAAIMPSEEMFGMSALQRNPLAENLRQAYGEGTGRHNAGGPGAGVGGGVFAPMGEPYMPQPEQQRTQEARPTVEGEFDGMMAEAMPNGGEAEPMGPPEMMEEAIAVEEAEPTGPPEIREERPRPAINRREEATAMHRTPDGAQGEATLNAPLEDENYNATQALGAIRRGPLEDDTQAERPAEDTEDAEAE